MLPNVRHGLAIVALVTVASLASSTASHAEEASAGAKAAAGSQAGGAKAGGDVAIQTLRSFIAEQKIDRNGTSWKMQLPRPPKATFDPAHTYYWNLDTNVGNVKVKLLPKVAPMHVSSTIYLTELGFYDGTPFHRVITRFMAQGGDPLGRGTGGPGYQYGGEIDPKLKHDKPGLLSMANAGPGTDGSQFFLTFVETSYLDGKHTVFGQVVKGMDTVKALEAAGSPSGATKEKLEIKKATIRVD
jgi:cyclophilin family peptidyl-prolyl cis-trans isomerase/uncharacterized membrane protein